MKILIAPLDWGLGHATRLIPVIREFLRRGWTVDLAVAGRICALYRSEFPELQQFEIPSYAIRYPECGFEMPLWLAKNFRRLKNVMNAEHAAAENLVQTNGYDAILSDNRFGFFAKNSYNIYMTHQLRIAFPGPFSAFEGLGILWHRRQMKRFDRVWIPDVPTFPGLAGKLSHVTPNAGDFVGLLSRFSGAALGTAKISYRFLAILSGPEPMRSSFEQKLCAALSKIPGRHALVRGLPGETASLSAAENIDCFNHLGTEKLLQMIRGAETVVSRSGYSTVMDLAALGARSVFVPTPGQTEQEYLGRMLASAKISGLIFQKNLTAENLLRAAHGEFLPWNTEVSQDLLASAIENLEQTLSRKSR